MSNEKLIALPGGRTLAYEDGGVATSSTVVIFFSGTLSVGSASRLPIVLESMGAHYIAPTLPGYGNTSPPAKGVSYASTIQSDTSALINHLHPDTTGINLYIGGGSFGTVPAQMLYGAPFDKFPAGRHLKGLVLFGAFPPFRDDKEKGFEYTKYMTWPNYFAVGPPSRFIPFRLLNLVTKLFISSKTSTQESAEAFIRGFLFDKMADKEKDMYKAWRERKGYEVGQLEREMAQMNRRSVEKSWEGFMSTAEVLHSDWEWGVKDIHDLDEEHTAGRKVLVIAGRDDDMTPGEWGKYLVSKYANARMSWLEGGHISAIFSMDDIWAEFMEYAG
ncbi:Alpha/Beta hydrolase protein [Collybia nuda]|uniref:Alpha/Beta hydrolase protein n=1 Tax=Collybia nuda TaxID=64659 RepID=A0A9P5YE63_9AGAR|nr:Alpha/Beta hydrolase protein [Collybia nuda]